MENFQHSQPNKLPNSQLSKMEIFQLAQQKFATIGINRELALQPYRLNDTLLMGFSMLGLSTVCIFEFTFLEAKTFSQYTQSSYMGSYMVTIILALLIIIFKVAKLFELINECEDLVNTSEGRININLRIFRKV